MEAQSELLFGRQAFRILLRHDPAFVGGREFQLVAVEFSLVGGQYGADGRQLEMSYPRKLVEDLLLLGLQLDAVGEQLPPAASAESEMFAERLETVRRGADDAHHAGLEIILLLLYHADVDHVAGYRIFYEYDLAFLGMGDALALCSNGLHGQVLYDCFCLFSCHFSIVMPSVNMVPPPYAGGRCRRFRTAGSKFTTNFSASVQKIIPPGTECNAADTAIGRQDGFRTGG